MCGLDIYAQRVDAWPRMKSLLTEPVASTLLVIDETGGASLTEISRATGKSLSTVQRAVNGLAEAGVLVREARRGAMAIQHGSTATCPPRVGRVASACGCHQHRN